MWCVPELNDEYIARMEDVLDVYERPYNPNEPVVCLDERPIVLHNDVRARSEVRPGRSARYDYEYARCGTANVFCAVEPLAGKHITKATPNRSGVEFAKMMSEIARRYPRADTIHIVLDNLSTHFESSLLRQYGHVRGTQLWNRFTVHYTPKHGSWLNQAEIEIGVFNRQCIGKRRLSTLDELYNEAFAWSRRANAQRLKIRWRFTKEKARSKFGYQPTKTTRSED